MMQQLQLYPYIIRYFLYAYIWHSSQRKQRRFVGIIRVNVWRAHAETFP